MYMFTLQFRIISETMAKMNLHQRLIFHFELKLNILTVRPKNPKISLLNVKSQNQKKLI
jgi:hypothetical protein